MWHRHKNRCYRQGRECWRGIRRNQLQSKPVLPFHRTPHSDVHKAHQAWTPLPQCARPPPPACLTSPQAKAPCNSTCFPLSYVLASCPTSVSASSHSEKHSPLISSRLLQSQNRCKHKKAVQCPRTARSEDAEGQSSRYLLILHQHPPSPPATLPPPLASCQGPTATLRTPQALRTPQLAIRTPAP